METELPKGLTLDIAKAWFGTKTTGRFNPQGAIGKAWLGLGCFPELTEIEDVGGAEYHRFADGTVFRGSERVAAAAGGGLPDGIGADLVTRWYGQAREGARTYRFAQDHPVGRLWLGLGRFPELEWVGTFDVRRYFRYADGTVIYRPDADTSGYRVMGANTNGGLFPDGMDQDLAELWFGEKFNPAGAVSQLWLKIGQQRKRFPAYLGDVQTPDGQFFRFADGSVFRRAQPDEDPTLFPAPVMSMTSIWGGGERAINQGFGPTPFSLDPDNCAQFYAWTADFGIARCSHSGLDIDMPSGTKLFAPMPGTVTCAGTGTGPGADGFGCAAYPDTDGGAGRLEFMMDNGVMLILGHASEADVVVGQRAAAGDFVGRSGTDNGDHLHLETRVRDQNTPSGWRIVDPRDILGR
ncbi:MAG TPA: peptidoglycan DD-metalloendopeptidase family protein [Thermomicrobiales bacterium]|jgi:murein DD-endopeptidase MepM/ murein hydrolase activator NlpD